MKVWEEFLQKEAQQLGSEAIEKWAKTLKVVDFDAANLYLEAGDSFQAHWFEEHLRPRLHFFRNNNGRPIKVHLATPQSLSKKKWKPTLNLAGDPLDPKVRFNTFFPAKADQTSLAMLQESLEKGLYNPIYLHGAEGVGKSHLLMAAAHFLQVQKKKCLYVKAGTLTQHIVAAIRSSSMQKFRDFYRQHDVLLVDDIDQLAHRSATQEELFHTFNTLHLAGKQILLAGKQIPSKLDGIEPRLTSRFEWGLVLPFHPLTDAERKEFLAHLNLPILEEVQAFLLSQFPSVKSLLRSLELLPLKKKDLTLTEVQRLTAPLVEQQRKKSLTPEKIVHATAEIFEIRPSDILGRSQNQECSAPRQVAMYLCRSLLKMPFLKIAEVFSRDHSTVMTNVKAIENKLAQQDAALLPALQSIQQKIAG